MRNKYDIYLGLHTKVIILEGVNVLNLNLNNEHEIELALKKIKPDILINTAGMTSVEDCELNPIKAYHINSSVPEILARIAKKLEIYFIHISTDHLFDGKNIFVSEIQQTCPLNVYGKSKELAENLILNENSSALIIRTNFFGWGTKYRISFSDFIINGLNSKEKVMLYDDVFFTPILIETLVDVTMELFNKNTIGIINIVGSERITKYEFGILLAKIFELDTSSIIRGSLHENLTFVNRPFDMSLSNNKLHNLLDISIPNLNKQLNILKSQGNTGIALELKSL